METRRPKRAAKMAARKAHDSTHHLSKHQHRTAVPGTLIGVILAVGFAYLGLTHAYALADWLKLRDYTAPAPVAALAQQTTMTDKSRHLFYINHPGIEEKTTFRSNCDKFGEETIVLGCYKGGQRGIHVLAVDDARLQGVEQVTAAHEMLHAAYDRLSKKDKARVDGLLQNFATTQLKDERIKKVLKGYETTEPGQQLNEMHSIFGTEVANLPSDLEDYYRQYFTNRKAVAAFAAQYQAAFTTRQDAINEYDGQLRTLGATIKNNTASLKAQETELTARANQLQQYRSSGNINAYNAGVPGYNDQVEAYNQLLERTKDQISQYNAIVTARNKIAVETTELQQAIDSSSLPQSK